jgi:hypothetical protein
MTAPLSAESDTALAIEPWLTGAGFVAIAMLIGLAYPPGVALLALALSLLLLVLRRADVLEALRAMGLTGILAAALGLWIIASVTWSMEVGPSFAAALPIGLLILLAGPALLLRAGMTAPDRPPLVAILLILALTGLLIFEAASGGAIARYVLGGISLTGALTGVLSLLLWPVALSVHRYFGHGEAWVWLVAALGLTFLAGGGVHGSILAPLAFALAFLAPLLSAVVLVVALLIGGILSQLSLTLVDLSTLQDIPGGAAVLGDFSARIAAWQDGLATWAAQPVLGYGFGSAASAEAGGGLILALLLGTGGVGLMLALVLAVMLILRVVRRGEERWRTACIAGLCGAAISTAGSGFGLGPGGLDGFPWGGLWFGTVALAGFALAAGKAPSGGALGSIFGTAGATGAAAAAAEDGEAEEEDDGLYHFDDDDEYDDDDEWDDEEDDRDGDAEDEPLEDPEDGKGGWRIDPDQVSGDNDGGTLPPHRS